MSIREKARRAWRAAKWVAWTALFLALATVAVATLFAVPQETGSASEFVWALVVVAVQVLDIVIPSMGTKRFGGSKYGVWGCNVGVIAGMFLGPAGIIIGPFVGAVAGELIKTGDLGISLKAGFGAFLGFLTGTVVKVVMVLCMTAYAVWSLF